jgi:hypothetical protein
MDGPGLSSPQPSGGYGDLVQFWWIAPGLALVVASFAITLLRMIVLVPTRRPQAHLALLSLRLRQIGLGLFFFGLGASLFLPALFSGPDVGQLISGALIAGVGGLYFISASDQMFKTGNVLAAPLHWQHRQPAANPDADPSETMEAKAERLHELMHPNEDASEKR